mgnify:CR=1 FL=1
MLEPTTVYTPSPNRYDSMTYNHAGESGLKLPAISNVTSTAMSTSNRRGFPGSGYATLASPHPIP